MYFKGADNASVCVQLLSVPFLANVGLLTMLFANFFARLFAPLNDFITSYIGADWPCYAICNDESPWIVPAKD